MPDEPAARDPVAALARSGPFFAVLTFDPAMPPGAPWRPMRALVDDPAVLADRGTTRKPLRRLRSRGPALSIARPARR